ncbi:hypothetical protein H920_17616 [Fukomys damarensis]|uniref:Uncharacterized protein n=1 Tax=Fukomys damarensis TaxID=885580 RepID=A0A091CSX3_FUKDA|nr:hypothetical protein H920_17616 [Fukomys damarensis]
MASSHSGPEGGDRHLVKLTYGVWHKPASDLLVSSSSSRDEQLTVSAIGTQHCVLSSADTRAASRALLHQFTISTGTGKPWADWQQHSLRLDI